MRCTFAFWLDLPLGYKWQWTWHLSDGHKRYLLCLQLSVSQQILLKVNSITVSSQLVKDTISAINLVGGKVDRLEISWIKTHVGHIGNLRADQLAREAVELTPTVHGIMLPSDQHYLQAVSWWMVKTLTCRLSKKILPFPCNRKSKEILKLSRSQMKRLQEQGKIT